MVELGDSPHAQAAMETARSLAQSFGARLVALTCLDERTVHSGRVRRMLEEHVRKEQEEFAERCRAEGIECVSELEVGDRLAALVNLSRRADLLVVGDADPSGEQAGIFSPAACSIAREVVRDVLFVGDQVPAFRSIVVGYAGQENSCNALRLAATIAEKSGGTVHVLTSEYDISRTGVLLTSAMEYLKAYEVKAERHGTSEDPDTAILELAARVEADLIAIGAYRKGIFNQLRYGTTAADVIERTKVPVLVCR
jgi:nucleotide-binding universal stress UspA family protein